MFRKVSYVVVGLAITVFAAACKEAESSLPKDMQELSADVPFLPSDYCLSRYCPDPLGDLAFRGNVSSGGGWLVIRHYGGEAGHAEHIEKLYTAELMRQDRYVANSEDEDIDPLGAVGYLKSESYAYTSADDAKEGFAGIDGQDLASNSLSGPLSILGYDEGVIYVNPQGLTTVRVRKDKLVFTLTGGTGSVSRSSLRDPLTRGIIYSMAMILARADKPAADMVIKGNVYFEDQLLPTTKQDVGGDIVFLHARVGPYRLAIDEYYSKPDYSLSIEGTAGLEGQILEIEFTSDHCGLPRNPDCFATERIAFQPGKVVETNLHFVKR